MHRYFSQLLVNTSVTILVRCWLLVKSRSIYHWPSSILPSVKYRSSVTQQIDQQSVMIASVVCWECVSGASVNNQHRLYNFFTNLISKAFPLQGYKVFVKWYEVDSINSYTTHGLFSSYRECAWYYVSYRQPRLMVAVNTWTIPSLLCGRHVGWYSTTG